MIRMLDNLALMIEIDRLEACPYTASKIRNLHPEKVIKIHTYTYIYRDVLDEDIRSMVTNLDNYLPLGLLRQELGVHKSLFKKRFKFMEESGTKLFDYINVGGVIFIRIDDEFKYLFSHYTPFIANFGDARSTKYLKLIGDIKIGFY